MIFMPSELSAWKQSDVVKCHNGLSYALLLEESFSSICSETKKDAFI